MEKHNNLFVILFIGIEILLYSCSIIDSELEQALSYSKKNRIEMEKVLNYYRNVKPDSLKLEAAKYLIINMPRHFSYDIHAQEYYDGIDSILNIIVDKDSIVKKIEDYSDICKDKINITEDIKCIKSEYLIQNIERSFELWETPWAKHLDFEEFCEYLLPYKLIYYQSIDCWKDSLFSCCSKSLNRIDLCQDFKYSSVAAASIVNDELKEAKKEINILDISALPIRNSRILMKLPFGSCFDYSLLAAMLMRSKGIPVAIDFTPQWPDRRSSHTWNVVLSSNRSKNVSFAGVRNNPDKDFFSDSKMSKVFRYTFTANKDLIEMNSQTLNVPDIFKNIFIKDVTEEYIKTVDVTIPVKCDSDYAYLCTFDNNEWRPVCWGKIRRNMASFIKIGRNIVYLPVIYSNNKMNPIGSAFLLDEKGVVKPVINNVIQKESITVNRKFPLFKHVYAIKWRLMRGKIQAANKPNFEDSVTISILPEWDFTSGNIIIDADRKYRYFRFMSSLNWDCDMAELFFYEKDSNVAVKSERSFVSDKYNKISYLINNPVEDRDLLTYFSSFGNSQWIAFDFGRPINLGKIQYIRRGDGNAICPGDIYELYFWNNDNWTLIEKQKSIGVELIFYNVPRNSLLYIKNSTKGFDNRIFFYREKEMVWY